MFSAAVAALLAFSVQDLRPNSQDTSAFYLGNIYQVLANPNITVPPSSIPIAEPPPFSPPRYAIWVNSLWFLSLCISLSCALLAISLQQWARRYIRLTQPSTCSPEKRARVRDFFAKGVKKWRLPQVVEILPGLIHLSVFLFFIGLAIFLLNVHHSVFLSVIWWIALVSTLYACITLMPLFLSDSPYYTPLSTPIFHIAWSFVCATLFVIFICFISLQLAFVLVVFILTIFSILAIFLGAFLFLTLLVGLAPVWIPVGVCIQQIWPSAPNTLPDWFKIDFISQLATCYRFIRRPLGPIAVPVELPSQYGKCMYGIGHRIGRFLSHWTVRDSRKAAEKITFNRSLKIDRSILSWSLGALGEDDTLENFFAAIPGFFHSHVVKPLKGNLPDEFLSEFASSWGGLMARNLLSNSVDDEVKVRRVVICMNAIKEVYNKDSLSEFLPSFSSLRFDQMAPSIQAAQILAPWRTTTGSDITSRLAQHTLAKMLPYVQERDNDWVGLATGVYDLPEKTLHDHIDLGDNSVLLAIFIHEARKVIHAEPPKWEMLLSISKFDITRTLPALQNEFCALWNEIVRQIWARNSHDDHTRYFFKEMSHLYAALHPSDEVDPTVPDPSYYPLCEIATHHPEPTHSDPSQPDPPHHVSPHGSHSESTPARPGSTAAPQVEEANVTPLTPALPSPTGYLTPNSQEFSTSPFIPDVT